MQLVFVKINEFFQTRKHLLFAVLILLTAFLTYFASQIKLSENIADFIPKDKQDKNITDVFEQIISNNKLIFILSCDDSSEASIDKMIVQADAVANDIKQQLIPEHVKELTYEFSQSEMMDTYDLFWRNLPFFLDDKDYDQIEKMIADDNVDTVLRRNFRMLVSPAGIVVKDFLVRDPFGMTNLAIKKLGLNSVGNNFLTYKDRIFSKDKKNLLMFIRTANIASESSKNAEMIAHLEEIIKRNTEANPDNKVKIQYFGAAAASVGNASQLKKDSMLTLGIAILILFVFLGIFFKNYKTIFFLLLPVVFGGVFSLAIIYFLDFQISTIAIGAGSIILGIAINYSIHFYAHYRHEKSIRQVIKDLATPMTIGSTTTIGAFLGLMMVKSKLLNDFGLMSALVLVGSVLFTLIFLPFFIRKTKVTHHETTKSNFIDRLSSYHFENNRYILIAVFVLTVFFFLKATNIGFEGDMKKLGFTSEKLKLAENTFKNISDSSLTDVFVVSKGKDLNESLKNNEQINRKIDELKQKHLISQITGVTSLLLSDSVQKVKINKWESFWDSNKKDQLKHSLLYYGAKLKFRESAFDEFFDAIERKYTGISDEDFEFLKKQQADQFISQKKGNDFVITLLKIKPENRSAVLAALPENEKLTVIENQNLLTGFVETINNDFNTILLISSLLVFLFLLLSYGRFELALIAFIPMVLSWVWILGIMNLFDLKFNIFSIIISAFIFGLGDDYSIFIMDGLLQRYKKGNKLLDSYKTAVFLSAFTTLVGVGVLIFAKHPALKSIAMLTIIGMFSVVFISYTVAPALFNLLVYKNNTFRKFPITVYGFAYAVVCYSYFFTTGIITALLGLTVYRILPITKRKRNLLYHYTLYLLCRTTMYLMYFTKKKVINFTPDTYKKPAVIVVNHQSIIDIPLLLMFSPKVIMITNDAFYNSKLIGPVVRMAGFLPASLGYDSISVKLASAVADGYSILVFPEGTRRNDGIIHRFHKGAFYLAEKLKLDILPMVTHGTGNYIAKGELMGKKSLITVKFLDRISYGDTSWGLDYSEKTKKVQQYLRDEYKKMLDEYHNKPEQLKDIIIKNFIYKGPVLEWYTRIKLSLEQKNYHIYNEVIPKNAAVLDIGCGYGYLSMMLGMISKDRIITAVDYDEEKIAVANNCMSKPINVDFVCHDMSIYEIKMHDVFILSDVLHYLTDDKQWALLDDCINNLNPGGKILLRDGNSDLQTKHKRTRFTEFLSTRIGFNKSDDNKLHFLSAKDLNDFCATRGMKLNVIDKGSLTSNMLFIIEKL